LVTPAGADAFTIFAQSLDRSGYARGTLAVREGLAAPVPELDRIVYLTMADMGHGAAAHASPSAHGEHAAPAPDAAHAGHAAHSDDRHDRTSPDVPGPQRHPPSEARNPRVDMQAVAPTARLDDPGVGLRDNGRRVLTYADLHALRPDPDGREPGRTLELHLTGHMERFLWSFDGQPFSAAEPIRLRYGERVRLTLVNDTMMEHPIHLHGMWSDVEDETGAFLVRKHT